MERSEIFPKRTDISQVKYNVLLISAIVLQRLKAKKQQHDNHDCFSTNIIRVYSVV